MRKKKIKCFLCGNLVLYDDLKQIYTCSKCNATHDSGVFEVEKTKTKRYRLTKIKIFVAVLAALFVIYYFFRFVS